METAPAQLHASLCSLKIPAEESGEERRQGWRAGDGGERETTLETEAQGGGGITGWERQREQDSPRGRERPRERTEPGELGETRLTVGDTMEQQGRETERMGWWAWAGVVAGQSKCKERNRGQCRNRG